MTLIEHYLDGQRVYTADEAAALRGEPTKTVQTRLFRAGAEPAGWINPRLAVYHPKDLGLEDTMAQLNLTRAAAAVISRARSNSGLTAPEFDYDIAVNWDQHMDGIGGTHSPLGVATYEIANQGHAGDADARDARFQALWDDLRTELTTYAARCRQRKYTGWSSAAKSRGQRVGYAD